MRIKDMTMAKIITRCEREITRMRAAQLLALMACGYFASS